MKPFRNFTMVNEYLKAMYKRPSEIMSVYNKFVEALYLNDSVTFTLKEFLGKERNIPFKKRPPSLQDEHNIAPYSQNILP